MAGKELREGLRFTIGDIGIAVVSDYKGWFFSSRNPRRRFLSSGRAEVTLRAHYKRPPDLRLKRKIFDTGTLWSLFTTGRRYVFKSRSHTAVLRSDFSSGSIYVTPDGKKDRPDFPFEYPLDEIVMMHLLSRRRGALLHACAVEYKGKGYIFAGSSGAGKSTIARLWKKEKDSAIVSDDRVIIRKKDRGFLMYGTPWHGDAQACLNRKSPLAALFFLKQSKKNYIKEIDPLDAASRLVTCTFPTFWDRRGMKATLDLCVQLARAVPCYEFGFLPRRSAIACLKDLT